MTTDELDHEFLWKIGGQLDVDDMFQGFSQRTSINQPLSYHKKSSFMIDL